MTEIDRGAEVLCNMSFLLLKKTTSFFFVFRRLDYYLIVCAGAHVVCVYIWEQERHKLHTVNLLRNKWQWLYLTPYLLLSVILYLSVWILCIIRTSYRMRYLHFVCVKNPCSFPWNNVAIIIILLHSSSGISDRSSDLHYSGQRGIHPCSRQDSNPWSQWPSRTRPLIIWNTECYIALYMCLEQ